MKVTLTANGSSRYALIRDERRDMIQLLQDGIDPADSLMETAMDLRADAQRLIDKAALLEEASIYLRTEGKK